MLKFGKKGKTEKEGEKDSGDTAIAAATGSGGSPTATTAAAAAAAAPQMQMKGDLEIRAYRKTTKDSRKKKERAAFEAKLKQLSAGYKAEQTLDDYVISRTLGTGSFGRVLLAQSKDDNGQALKEDFKAIKVISKERVIKTRQVEHTINEKNILFCTDCKFVVRLYDYFQDVKSLYFVLEFVNGGEMFTHIQKQRKRRFTEEQVYERASRCEKDVDFPFPLRPASSQQRQYWLLDICTIWISSSVI